MGPRKAAEMLDRVNSTESSGFYMLRNVDPNIRVSSSVCRFSLAEVWDVILLKEVFVGRYVRILLAGVLVFAFGVVQAEEEAEETGLKVGDVSPAFEAKADDGKLWKSEDHVSTKTMVVYFYPAALTGG
jgi:hypothetical protein